MNHYVSGIWLRYPILIRRWLTSKMDDSFFSEALIEEFDLTDLDYSYSRDLQSIEGLMEVDSSPLTTVDDSR